MIISRTIAVLPLALAGALCLGCIPDQAPDKPADRTPSPAAPAVRAAPAKPLVDLTPVAASKVAEIIRQGQEGGTLPKGTLYFRVRLVAGGCCGFLHKLDLDPETTPGDQLFDVGGRQSSGLGAPGRHAAGHAGRFQGKRQGERLLGEEP